MKDRTYYARLLKKSAIALPSNDALLAFELLACASELKPSNINLKKLVNDYYNRAVTLAEENDNVSLLLELAATRAETIQDSLDLPERKAKARSGQLIKNQMNYED